MPSDSIPMIRKFYARASVSGFDDVSFRRINHQLSTHEENADARGVHRCAGDRNWQRSSVHVLDNFTIPILMLDFAPELFNLAFRSSPVGCDVVKSYDSTAPHKRRVHLEVALHSGVSVIPVEK